MQIWVQTLALPLTLDMLFNLFYLLNGTRLILVPVS